ncbi:DUF2511 domain-containing protein [Candidatus Palauibacter sp.]|uniref:DUF2511 domain-containing protein n=1 Tax=Candidatus Palauibacter sp. TaxID=3101350 RepID=UPI003B01B442
MRIVTVLLLGVLVGCAEPSNSVRSTRSPESGGLQQEREISRADFGETWPFTVGSGMLRCGPGDAVTFTADGTVYAVNGVATTFGSGVDIEPIWAYAPQPDIGVAVVERLSMADREAIFAELGECEDMAMERAEAEIPVTDRASLHAMAERQGQIEDECKSGVRNGFGISEDEATRIVLEGISSVESMRLRVDIGPVIRAGLELCDG